MKPATSELRRNLSLILFESYAQLRAESERTYVGFLWWIVEPLLSLAVYYFVFSFVLSRGTENYVVFLFVGLVPWRWFQTTILRSAGSIIGAKPIMQQVHVPKVIFPLISVLTDSFKFAIVFLIVLAFVAASGFGLALSHLALVAVLLVQVLLITACSVLVAAVTPFLPDLRIVIQNVLRLCFFLSGVFYDIAVFPERFQGYLRLNPMAVILESYRSILMEAAWPDLWRLGIIAVVSLAILAVGVRMIFRYEFRYPKLKL